MWKSSNMVRSCLLPEQVAGYYIYGEGGFEYEIL